MRLTRLAARSFRNLAPFELDTDAPFVVLHGPNAHGKTNTLEAAYLLATLRPLRARRNQELIAWGETEAVVSGTARTGGVERSYRVEIGPEGRKPTLDGKRVADLGDYFAGIRAIAFTPADVGIVLDEPARRRDWVDRAAFNRSPAHLDVVRAYRRGLAQKSAALRAPSPDRAVIRALDDRLAQDGGRLIARRRAVLAELEPFVREVHARIAGHALPVHLAYRSVTEATDASTCAAALREVFERVHPDEVRRRRALAGPQRDEVGIAIDEVDARTFASRGQVRSLVLSLKLAELSAARGRGLVPMFLFDDVSSELDAARTERLVELLGEMGSQVLATTTDPRQLDALPRDQTLKIGVEKGVLTAS